MRYSREVIERSLNHHKAVGLIRAWRHIPGATPRWHVELTNGVTMTLTAKEASAVVHTLGAAAQACGVTRERTADQVRLAERAERAALPALELLGDYIGNAFAGKIGIPAFDRCAIIWDLKAVLGDVTGDRPSWLADPSVDGQMRPGAGAGRPSCLAVNPGNLEASAARRARLLAAFNSLDVNDRADLLEAVEAIVGRAAGGVDAERDRARGIIREAYAAAGWGDAGATAGQHTD